MKNLISLFLFLAIAVTAFCADTLKSVQAYSESGRFGAPTNLLRTNLVQGTNIIFEYLPAGRIKIHGTGGGSGGSGTNFWSFDVGTASLFSDSIITNGGGKLQLGPATLSFTNGNQFNIYGQSGIGTFTADGFSMESASGSPRFLSIDGISPLAIFSDNVSTNAIIFASGLISNAVGYAFPDGSIQTTAAIALSQMGTSNATHIPILWGTNVVQLIQGTNVVLYTVSTGIVVNAVSAADFISSVNPEWFEVITGLLNLTNQNLTNWSKYTTNTFAVASITNNFLTTNKSGFASANGVLTSLMNASNPPIIKTISASGSISATDQTTNIAFSLSAVLTNGIATQIALTHAGTVTLDLSAMNSEADLTGCTGAVVFATSNLAAGHNYILFCRNTNALNVTATFPSWAWQTIVPVSISAGKTFAISLNSRGSNDTNVWAAYSEAQ